jgi:hypothetical protein
MKWNQKLFAAVLLLSTVALNAALCYDSCDCEATSKTYLAVRPHFQSASPELVSAFRSDRMNAREDGKHGAIQFVLFGSKSTNSHDLARYFFPFCKTQLRVASSTTAFDATTQLVDADLLAENFNIFTQNGEFESLINICPKQSVFGFGIHARKGFCRNEEKGRGFWASISIPIERVTNNMNLTESVINDGGGADATQNTVVVANMREALNQSDWNSCRIGCGSMTESGVADIEVKLGYEWLDCDPCHIESYIGVLAPAGRQADGKYLFSPTIGFGKHWGIMFGGAFGAQVWGDEEKDRTLRFEVANHTQYLFSKTMCRCFDLFCKPWSRYLPVYINEAQATEASLAPAPLDINLSTPGVNVFTLGAEVTPGWSHDFNTALVYTSGKFQGELGYNLYARQAECVTLACDLHNDTAIKSIRGLGQTNPDRDITASRRLNLAALDVPLAEYENSVITDADIDLTSAAAPAGISNMLYGTLGWRWDEREYPVIFSVGASYEVSRGTNGMVDRWTGWGKVGFSF